MKIIIAGAGKVGSHLAKMLSRERNELTVIDNNSERIAALSASVDVDIIEGKPSSISTLREAQIDKADLFIAVYPADTQEVNITSALVAKNLGAAKVIARVNDEEYLNAENKLMFKEMGIELMFYPEKIAADEIADQLRHSATSETMDFVHGKLQISVFKLGEDSPILEKKIAEFMQGIPAEEARSFRVIAISRNDHTLIPRFDTRFQYDDMIFTIATREGAGAIVKYFGRSTVDIAKTMILGGDEIGAILAGQLSRRMSSVKLIEKDRAKCVALSEKLPSEVQIVCADARNSDLLFEEGIRDYDAFVAVTDNDEENILSCVIARKYGVPRTVAEVENVEYVRLAEDMGVDTVINKKLITAGRIFKFTLSGKARFVHYMSGTSAQVMEYTVAPDSAITKGALKDIPFPSGAIIGGVVRGSEAFIAVGDTRIEAYDRVAVFAMPETIKEIDRFFK